MKIEQFEMERTQSLYEHAVDYNLAESGVSPLSVNDLVSAETLAELAAMPLCYPEGMGSELLRERIALFYDNATADNIVVTNGGSEANYIALQALLEPGDRVACMIPNYLQTWGLARAYSERTDAFHLVESRGGDSARWALDLDSLAAAVSPATGMITVTNPNNPSGAVLDEAELEALVEAARRADAWLVFDEIYRGTELEGGTCPSIWDRYDKAIVTSGLSKAFAMPGLRIGWTVAPEPATQQMMRYRDYTTLTPNLLADRLARIAARLGFGARAEYWRGNADRIHATVCDNAWNADINSFVESFGDGEDVDASLLLLHDLGFLAEGDPRFAGTVDRIEKILRDGDFLFRYKSADDFGTPETSFTICTFWYIDALAALGRHDEARRLFENVLACRNHVGLLSEDLDPNSRELWGNFPQTYSMVGLISSAMRLSRSWEEAF